MKQYGEVSHNVPYINRHTVAADCAKRGTSLGAAAADTNSPRAGGYKATLCEPTEGTRCEPAQAIGRGLALRGGSLTG
jgi:hypothetical protein